MQLICRAFGTLAPVRRGNQAPNISSHDVYGNRLFSALRNHFTIARLIFAPRIAEFRRLNRLGEIPS